MIGISTDDGETFEILIDDVAHEVHRNELVPFLDQATVLLDVTREMITEPIEE
jgi:hypothetical protein